MTVDNIGHSCSFQETSVPEVKQSFQETSVPEVKQAMTHVVLTHWGRVTHISVSKQTIISLYNGLSPGRRQAIIWTNAGILLIGRSGTNFTEITIEIHTFPFKKIHVKMSSAKWQIFCLGLNVLRPWENWLRVECNWITLECHLWNINQN